MDQVIGYQLGPVSAPAGTPLGDFLGFIQGRSNDFAAGHDYLQSNPAQASAVIGQQWGSAGRDIGSTFGAGATAIGGLASGAGVGASSGLAAGASGVAYGVGTAGAATVGGGISGGLQGILAGISTGIGSKVPGLGGAAGSGTVGGVPTFVFLGAGLLLLVFLLFLI